MRAIFKIAIISAIFLNFGSLSFNSAKAATLYILPDSGNYRFGDIFFVKIKVSSTDQSINAVQGALSFSPKLLSIVNVSKTGSIISLWVREPNYSNVTGLLSFSGVILNPGFQGDDGTVLLASFAAKRPGSVTLNIKNGSVLANDGLGTELLSSVLDATYSLTSSTAANIRTPIEQISPSGQNIQLELTPGQSLLNQALTNELDQAYNQLSLIAEIMVAIILAIFIILIYKAYRHLFIRVGFRKTNLPQQTPSPPPDQPRQPDNDSYVETKYAKSPTSKNQNLPPHLSSDYLKEKQQDNQQ